MSDDSLNDEEDTVEETNQTEMNETEEPENHDHSHDGEGEEGEGDPFPEDAPVSVRRRVQTFQNRLEELGVEIQAITRQREETDEDTEEDGELMDLALRCQYQNAPFLIFFPVEEQFAVFQAEYDVITDMIFASKSDHLGGDFEKLEPEARWEVHQTVRQNLTPEQVVGLLQSNRAIPTQQLEAWFSILRTSSDKFTVETTKIGAEYPHAVTQRRLYTNPNNLTTQQLYDTVSQLLSIRQAVQDILGGAYILGGVEVPDNFASLHPDVEKDPRDDHSQPYNKGFQ